MLFHQSPVVSPGRAGRDVELGGTLPGPPGAAVVVELLLTLDPAIHAFRLRPGMGGVPRTAT